MNDKSSFINGGSMVDENEFHETMQPISSFVSKGKHIKKRGTG